MSFFNKIFGDPTEKYIKNTAFLIQKINQLGIEFGKLSNDGLREKTLQFKERLKNGEDLKDLLPEVFAQVKETAKRTLNQSHFDVQLIGGIVLHEGKIAEMKTGEGKTLTATLSTALNALTGKGVHIVTINDYLAKRDTVWMGQVNNALGFSVGCIVHDLAYLYDPNYKVEVKDDNKETANNRLPDLKDKERDLLGSFKVVESYLRPVSRKEAYLADITYGTNNEFGFDYLKDNMTYDLESGVQRGFNFAIVDEVDSILIDEARTPLIISGRSDEKPERYYEFARLVAGLGAEEDYAIDEKARTVVFTEKGQTTVVKRMNLDPWLENDIHTTHLLEAALKAKTLFKRDKDYVVKDGQIIIVDEFTGRMLPGRRYSAGLHQAIEAKEGVQVREESRTLASITFQNYFRMYKKLAGMTGTALTSAEEFDKVYKLEVVPIPTNKPMARKELPDRVYKTMEGKFKALVQEIKDRHKNGQSVLVGTTSIEKNEYLGKVLEREGVPHQILNAKHHEREGQIIAQAGKLGGVTIATNMAGRGVDIILGGNPPDAEEQKKVIELGGLHVIGTERHEARRIDNQLRGRSGRQGDPGSSQFFVSLEDDLMRIFGGDRIKSLMQLLKVPEDQPIEAGMVSKAIESAQSQIEGFHFDLRKHVLEYDEVMNKHREVFYKKRKEILEMAEKSTLKDYILDTIKKAGLSSGDYDKKEKEMGEGQMRQAEKVLCLQVLDYFWVDHLESMEHLRDSVRLRAYGQQDPLVEYKREGHKMFQVLLATIEQTIANAFSKIESGTVSKVKPVQTVTASSPGKNIGRNDPCPCGSGKKFKRCGLIKAPEHRQAK